MRFDIDDAHEVVRLLCLRLVKRNGLKPDAVAEKCTVVIHHHVRDGQRVTTVQGMSYRIESLVDLFQVCLVNFGAEHLVVNGGINGG